jgi:hypothetical protein
MMKMMQQNGCLVTLERNDGPFMLALEALGLPVVQRLDEKSTAAM